MRPYSSPSSLICIKLMCHHQRPRESAKLVRGGEQQPGEGAAVPRGALDSDSVRRGRSGQTKNWPFRTSLPCSAKSMHVAAAKFPPPLSPPTTSFLLSIPSSSLWSHVQSTASYL
eukprot:TRINITY_DN2473_c0_g1_i1.p2 TRINITY_DN2473_c0_g1~~TRINITY_DN2473_c0_g1_i1.p2  ORF type:complete len:115 (+),score=5.76 TRINITY_DN2473_c0_g1_i1:97-441(+)